MTNDILNAANKYTEGLKNVETRRRKWIEKSKEVKEHLKLVAKWLNENATYKQGFYVDGFHAFNEEIDGTCADMPGITFRSGSMTMAIEFRNAMGDKKEYIEKGFRLMFNPVITGHIAVLLYPHHNELNDNEAQYITLLVIDNSDLLTTDELDKIVAKALEVAFYSSFTGMSEPRPALAEPSNLQIPKHNTVGFKRFDTTEKV